MGLRAKSACVFSRGHVEEASALMLGALQLSIDHELLDYAAINYFILSDQSFRRDRYAEAIEYLEEALKLVRRLGDRPGEWGSLSERTYALYMLGRWDEAQAARAEFTPDQLRAGGVMLSLLQSGVEIHLHRGELDEAREVFALFSGIEDSTDVQDRSMYFFARACLHRAEGRLREALADGEATIEVGRTLAISFQGVKQAIVEALEAAFALDEPAKVEELLALIESIPAGTRPPFLDAHARRFRARLAGGDREGYEQAAERFRELGLPFWLAVTLLEQGDPDGLREAREIFERLGAAPWLERLAAAEGVEAAGVPA
jgi:tetratricopeptide (TPR) repeat protein